MLEAIARIEKERLYEVATSMAEIDPFEGVTIEWNGDLTVADDAPVASKMQRAAFMLAMKGNLRGWAERN